MIKDKEKFPGSATNDGTKIYEVKLDFGLSEKEAQILVDKIVMPFLSIDRMLAAIEKPVNPKPRPKYKLGDTLFGFTPDNAIYTFQVTRINLYQGSFQYVDDTNAGVAEENQLWPTKNALIDAQITY